MFVVSIKQITKNVHNPNTNGTLFYSATIIDTKPKIRLILYNVLKPINLSSQIKNRAFCIHYLCTIMYCMAEKEWTICLHPESKPRLNMTNPDVGFLLSWPAFSTHSAIF